MRLGIVAPISVSERGNPGCHLITAGIRHLVRIVRPGVQVEEFSMLRRWTPAELERARGCDALVLAGNPRYDLGNHAWLYAGLIDQMAAAGRPMIDAWSGASTMLGRTVEADVDLLLANPRNTAIIERLRAFDGCITRDARAQAVNLRAGIRSLERPCSSWWARLDYGVERRRRIMDGERVLVVLRSDDRRIADSVRELVAAGWRAVATVQQDLAWCESRGVAAQLIFRPADLLRLYANCSEVITYRLHAAIPAASLGARVAMIAIDTRAQACDAFGIPWAGVGEARPVPMRGCLPATMKGDRCDALDELLRR